jgi:hypothetical protein
VGGEIILLNCCKCLQINSTFFQAIAARLRSETTLPLKWIVARVQPASGNRSWQGIDPGFRLPPTNICDHFLRKAPFCWALSKRHSSLTLFL